MWIMINNRHLNLEETPEFGSIHWATPVVLPVLPPAKPKGESQFDHNDEGSGFDGFGIRPSKTDGVVQITINRQTVTLFSCDYSATPPAVIDELLSEPGLYEFIPHAEMERAFVAVFLDSEQRFIRDAAMVDGANEEQAQQVALGVDILEPGEWSTAGWYRAKFL